MFFNCIKVTAKCLHRVNQSNVHYITPIIRLQSYSDWHHRRPNRIVNEEEILQHVEEARGPHEFIGDEYAKDPDHSEVKRPQRNRKVWRSSKDREDNTLTARRNRPLAAKSDEPLEPLEDETDRKPLKKKPKPKSKSIKKKLVVTPDDTKLREDGSFNMIELKETDPILTTLMMSVRSRKLRDRNSRIILEGRRLIEDALHSGAVPEIIVFSRIGEAMALPLPDKGVRFYKVPYRSIQTWSTLVTSPGLMGFFRIPDVEKRKPASDSLPLTIICDNVRDPGNLGSILRAAAAVGCKKLITLVGCVDIWDPKVLKSAAGSHFRLPIFAAKTWEDIPHLTDSFANVYVADNNTLKEPETSDEADESSDITDVAKMQTENESIQETAGDMAELAEVKRVEDLENVAEVEDMEEVESDEELDDTDIGKLGKRKTNYQRLAESKVAEKLTAKIPVIPYYGSDYTENENIIILGGETLGLSMEALHMVNERYGVRVNIPMTNGVESLNTGMALGIIAFEIRRQHAIASNETET